MSGIQNLYRGWFVLAACYLVAGLMVGSTNYAFALFIKPVAAEFGLSRADTNTGLIIYIFGTAIASPFIGRLLDRVPLQRMMPIGAAVFATCFVAMSLTHSLWVMTILLLVTAAGAASCGAPAANKAVTTWFRRRRGRAMGLQATATSAGGTVVVPVMAVLVEQFGWRMALAIEGLVAAAVVAVLALFVIRKHEGTLDPIEREAPDAAPPAEEHAWTVRELLRTRNFWLIALSIGLMLAIDQSLIATLVAYATDRGIPLTQASFLMSALGISAIAGKLLSGFLAERFDQRLLLAAVAISHMFFLTVLIVDPSWTLLITSASVAGLAVGGTYPIWQLVVAMCFGGRSFASVIGTMNPVALPLSMLATRFVGEVFDRTGHYDFAFQAFLVASVVSAILIMFVRPPRRNETLAPSAQPAMG
jgi:sugar phosphate permease